MLTIHARNVNSALPEALYHLRWQGQPIRVRGHDTIEAPDPVMTVYERPLERVLFDEVRDANPWLHFFEALWILAGRDDVQWPAQFARRLLDYSDDGLRFHAAYGHRLRVAHGDQLAKAIMLLREESASRRAVLSIWDAARDLGTESKDLPCNTTAFLKVRTGALHLTVCNRSNDAIWGLYGANAVQFSMLQEYLAAHLGVAVGTYRHLSDSLHVYCDNPYWQTVQRQKRTAPIDSYASATVRPFPLVDHAASWDEELKRFLADPMDELGDMFPKRDYWRNRLFPLVAQPLYAAWQAHKAGHGGAALAATCAATDWRLAAMQWLARRGDTFHERNGKKRPAARVRRGTAAAASR